MQTVFTSESVTRGQSDKLCDQIADRILDKALSKDKNSHVACEVSVTTDQVHIFGEISTKAKINYEQIARQTIADIGYTEKNRGFDAQSCEVLVNVHEQSSDIANGIRRSDILNSGAGDQGMMFGYACDETVNFMPIPIELAHALAKRLEYVRKDQLLTYLLPDGKVQVTLEYEDLVPKHISTVLVAAQHKENVLTEQLRADVLAQVILPVLPQNLVDDKTAFFINSAGRFVNGGPAADAGLTGRKIMVDTYGAYARHGGGSFSGKDATKVDKSGAYAARYLAKNVVAQGFAKRCEVSLAYAIGLMDPVSIGVETFGTESIPRSQILSWVSTAMDLRPAAIIERFGLCSPMYSNVSCYGHFGENAKLMPWERTDIK